MRCSRGDVGRKIVCVGGNLPSERGDAAAQLSNALEQCDTALTENGFDGLGTGHYCIRKETGAASSELWEGRDKNKDQSYFLARITPEQLFGARFPLGESEKPRVREIARELDLHPFAVR